MGGFFVLMVLKKMLMGRLEPDLFFVVVKKMKLG